MLSYLAKHGTDLIVGGFIWGRLGVAIICLILQIHYEVNYNAIRPSHYFYIYCAQTIPATTCS